MDGILVSGMLISGGLSPQEDSVHNASYDHRSALSSAMPTSMGFPPFAAPPRLEVPSGDPTADASVAPGGGGGGASGPSGGVAHLEGIVQELRRLHHDSRQSSPARDGPREGRAVSPAFVADGPEAGGAGCEDLDSLMQQVRRLQTLLSEGPYPKPEERRTALEDKPGPVHQPLPPPSPFSKGGGTRAQLAEVLSRLGSGSAPSPSPSSRRSLLGPSGSVGSAAGGGEGEGLTEEDLVWEEFQV